MAHILTVVASSFSTISFLRELAILINVIIVDPVWESSYYSLVLLRITKHRHNLEVRTVLSSD